MSCETTTKLPVTITVDVASHSALHNINLHDVTNTFKHKAPTTQGVADTGATVVCAGPNRMSAMEIDRSALLPAKLIMRTADNRKLSVLGALPVIVKTSGLGSPYKTMIDLYCERAQQAIFEQKLPYSSWLYPQKLPIPT